MRIGFIILTLCIAILNLNAAEPNLNLRSITENFDGHKDKEITILLRLKYIDFDSKKIVFYDLRNRDISFDFSNNRPMERLIKDNPRLIRGLIYQVRFVPRSLDEFLFIKADLLNFEPLFLEKLP